MGQGASNPLESVKSKSDDEIVKLLSTLVETANPVLNSKDEEEKSILHWASSEGKDQTVEFILKHRIVNVDSRDVYKNTPLHSAVFKNRAIVATKLIQNGANIEAQDDAGMTPLHWAVRNMSKECVEVLIAAGANVETKNNKGQTARDIAASFSRKTREIFIPLLENKFSSIPIRVSGYIEDDDDPKTAILREILKDKLFNELLRSMPKDRRRLLATCQLWGFIKYHHPFMAYRNIKWDEALIEVLPTICNPATTDAQFLQSLIKLLSKIGDPNTRLVCGSQILTLENLNSSPNHSNKLNSSTDTTNQQKQQSSSNNETTPQLDLKGSIEDATRNLDSIKQPKLDISGDKIALISCTDYSQFENVDKMQEFIETFSKAFKFGQAFIFDVRCVLPPSLLQQLHLNHPNRQQANQHSQSQAINQEIMSQIANSKGASNLAIMFQEAFRIFLSDTIVLPVTRQRMYQGLPPHSSSIGSSHLGSTNSANFGHPLESMEHGILMSEAILLHPFNNATNVHSPSQSPNQDEANPNKPNSQPSTPSSQHSTGSNHPIKPSVFIMDKFTPKSIYELALAMQSRKLATIVFEVEKSDSTSPIGVPTPVLEPWISTYSFNLSQIIEDFTLGSPTKLPGGFSPLDQPHDPSVSLSPSSNSSSSQSQNSISNNLFGFEDGSEIVVQIRINERLNPDSTMGFKPDQIVQIKNGDLGNKNARVVGTWPNMQSSNSNTKVSHEGNIVLVETRNKALNESSNVALEMALNFCYGLAQLNHQQAPLRHIFFPIKQMESELAHHQEESPGLPSLHLRYLSLFRIWNAILYFCAYTPQLLFRWEVGFLKFLGAFTHAKDAQSYALAISELLSLLCDSHAFVRSSHLGNLIGTHVPPIRVKTISGKTVVTHISDLSSSHGHAVFSGGVSPRGSSGSSGGDQQKSSPHHSDHAHDQHSHDQHSHDHHNHHHHNHVDQSKGVSPSMIVVRTKHKESESPRNHFVPVDSPSTISTKQPTPPNQTTPHHHLIPQLSVQVGDVITHIDGVEISQRQAFLSKIFGSSTPQSSTSRSDLKLLAGNESSLCKLTIERQQKNSTKISLNSEVTRSLPSHMVIPKTSPVSHILEILDKFGKKIAYIDLTRLPIDQVDSVFTSLSRLGSDDLGAIIFDIRGSTKGTIQKIAPKLACYAVTVSNFSTPFILPSSSLHSSINFNSSNLAYQSSSMFSSSSPSSLIGGTLMQNSHRVFPSNFPTNEMTNQFSKVKLIALINEETIAQGEYAALTLKSVRPDLVLVGTQTNGSIGIRTNLPLPGGILVGFTAMSISSSDSWRVQFHGIVPDVEVQDNLESILTGKDLFMEAALQIIR